MRLIRFAEGERGSDGGVSGLDGQMGSGKIGTDEDVNVGGLDGGFLNLRHGGNSEKVAGESEGQDSNLRFRPYYGPAS